MEGIRLIVGLGNPGREYEATRHNAGFWWVDRLAAMAGATLRQEAKFHGQSARAALRGHDLWLLQPMTYMNASGRAVAALAGFYKVTPEQVLVVHDELDLQPGAARLKQGGGVAGHNGLKDIQAALKTPNFWRLRLGVGRPAERGAMADYVLHPPGRAEREAIDAAIERSLTYAAQLAAGDFGGAMLALHTKDRTA